MIKNYLSKINKEGFTLIETLVAITILLVAIASPLTIASKSLFSSNVARDQIVAFYLTQDAIEYVRSVRDSNYLESSPWLSGLSECISPNVCFIDTTTPSGYVETCPGGVCPVLSFDYDSSDKSGSRFYGYNYEGSGRNWEASNFTRSIKITQESGGSPEARVEVTVSWNTGVISRSFTAYEILFDW